MGQYNFIILPRIWPKWLSKNIETAAFLRKAYRQGYIKGLEEGFDRGYSQGYDSGLSDGPIR